MTLPQYAPTAEDSNPIEPMPLSINFKRSGPTANAKNWVTFNVWHEDADRAEMILRKGD